jgi:hypothetical protein
MCLAGEYPAALDVALEMLRSNLDYVEQRQIADLYLTVEGFIRGGIDSRKGSFATAQSLLTRPVLGRPLLRLLIRLRLVRDRCSNLTVGGPTTSV